MILHSLLRNHRADPFYKHRENGVLVSRCKICRRAMVGTDDGKWQLRKGRLAP